MGKATATYEELRFDVRDPHVTHVYVLVRVGGDSPLGVQGWHYKAFPAGINAAEVLLNYFKDVVLWPQKAPDND